MKKTTYTVTRYDIKEGFYVEVTPDITLKEEIYKIYLCSEDYDIKMFVYGILKKHTESEEHILSIINSDIDRHIEHYRNQFA